MEFKEYQKLSRRTAKYPAIGANFVYPALGLGNEAGEVNGKIKKIFRDNNGVVSEAIKADIKKELGDVLWYLTQLATEFDMELEDIAQDNLDKLMSRMERGVLNGDGDNR